MISQVRSGALEFCAQSGPALSLLVPATAINSIGFAFKREDEVWTAMDGELGAYVRGQIEKTNLVAMESMWGHGFRHMTSSVGPITSPTDLRSLKIRVPAGPIFISLFKALDASATTINFNELYSALQTRVVDAQENPVALLVAGKLYEVQKYLSLTGHMWAGYWFLANRRAFEALPGEIRAVVARVVNECGKEQRAELVRQEAANLQELASHGVIVNKVEPAVFRDTLSKAGYYKEWQDKLGAPAWSILEKYAGRLA
jgi:tripartite ATP-independent transporter DctP family solute receptor